MAEGKALLQVGRFAALSGAGSIAIGVLMLLWPGRTLLVVAWLIGAHLIVSGLGLIVARVRAGRGLGHRILGTLAGVLTVVLGFAVPRLPVLTLALVVFLLGISWLVSGIAEIIEGAGDRGNAPRGTQMAGGIVTALAGLFMVLAPLRSLAALAIWAGIFMILVGLSRILISMRARRLRKAIRRAED
ncbi:MAG: hypothetical protein F4Y40_06205 [Acidimicrobiia bacterium]|nr:hypothetical protein [Acidimicrobiia bacterium]